MTKTREERKLESEVAELRALVGDLYVTIREQEKVIEMLREKAMPSNGTDSQEKER